jgi:MscS family membrane protein
LQDKFELIQSWAGILGPNIYIQAIGTAIAFILLGKIAETLISKVFLRLVSHSKTNMDNDIVSLLHKPVFLSFVLLGLAMGTRRLDLGDSPEFVTLGVLRSIGIVIWYSFLRGLMFLLLRAAAASKNLKRSQASMLPLMETGSRVILLVLATYFFFLAWNINVTAWVASAGIVGLALSFAAKDSLSNLFAGVSIAADAPYKVGDFIVLESGERGEVTQIGLRSTRMLTRDDVEITIPNGVIGNSKIINEAGGPSSRHRIRVDVGVAYGSDIDKVIRVLNDIAVQHAEICNQPAARVRMRNFGDSSLDFQLLCWIEQSVDRGRLRHELMCTIYKTFNDEDIQIPFPQRDLHVRTMTAIPD